MAISGDIKHRLIEGGIGDVVPAEMYQGVADFQRSTVGHLALEHDLDWRGVPIHKSMRWFSAVAHIEITEGPTMWENQPKTRLLFSYGFKEPPSIKSETRTVLGLAMRGWWVDWKAEERRFVFGFRVFDGGGVRPSVGPGRIERDGRGWLRLGILAQVTDGEDETIGYEPSPELLNIRAVTLALF